MKIVGLSLRNEIKNNRSDLVEIDNITRNKLHAVLLSMYKDLRNVCTKYGLTPFLVGGSALGAYRHKGFIPWDDDMDIGMTRHDFEMLVKVFGKELSNNYVLNAPNLSRKPKSRFAKILKKGTVCRELMDNSPNSECGVFIDIFIIDNVPNSMLHRGIKGCLSNFFMFVSGQVLISFQKELVVAGVKGKIRRVIGSAFSFLYPEQWYNLIDKTVRYRDNSSRFVSLATGRKHYFGEIIRREVLFPPRYIDFCDIKVPVFNKVEEYLENLYGSNYMEVPSKEKRERHYVTRIKL